MSTPSSGLTPEQRLAFRVMNFNGVSVEDVIRSGEKQLPFHLHEDPEVKAVFEKARAQYQEWSFMCEGKSVFNEKTAALLLSLGVLSPEFFTVLLQKIRFEMYKKHVMLFLEQVGRGEYLGNYFDTKIDMDPNCHHTFLRDVLPKIAEVFIRFRTEVWLDISHAVGKFRFLVDISEMLNSDQTLASFKDWSPEDLKNVREVFQFLREGVRTKLGENMAVGLAEQTAVLMSPMNLEQVLDMDEFLKSIEDQFDSSQAKEDKDEPPSYDAGHGWEDEEDHGELL